MKSDMVKKMLLVAMVAALGACNTVQGAGQDVESIGKAGERELDRAKRDVGR